ncbi:MAG TPA: glycoside hydrolase family 76 protein [Polyangia bacterium]|nr:glycoside hydrolase family 76 protein [Polyangia bacterium]
MATFAAAGCARDQAEAVSRSPDGTVPDAAQEGAGPDNPDAGTDAAGLPSTPDASSDASSDLVSNTFPDAASEAAPDIPAGPPFDASALTVVGTPGEALCRLSDDGRHVVVTIKNGGSTDTGATTVRVATAGSSYEVRLATPKLAAGLSADLSFDRGPLVGYVEDWRFAVTIDPDGAHGAAHAPVAGECHDLRSRAAAAMVPLQSWYDTTTGLWNHTDWWTSANQLETVIDYARETGDPTYFADIDTTFTKNAGNDFDQFGYYDDDGWWAVAWIKAYDLTHQQKYLDMAKTIFARMAGGWDSKCGGGIYWASAKAGGDGLKNKNAIPNELFLQVAAKLHQRTPGDGGAGSYLDWAQREWAWFKGTGMITAKNQIVDGLDGLTTCKAAGPIFTYNQGVIVGGLVDLAAGTGDATLLDQASAIAHATMSLMSTSSGVLKEAPCGGDICTQFKGVFMRNLSALYRARPAADLQLYMRRQSDTLWAARNAQTQFGYEWDLQFDKATASRQSSAIDALVAAIASSNLNLALGATATGSAACSASEVASNVADGSSRANSKWCSGGAGGQTLQLDLGAPLTVVGFRLRHAGAGGEPTTWDTRDFELDTSTDAQTWSRAVTVTGNTSDVTTHPIPALTARYARLHVTQAQTSTDIPCARIYELEVFGVGR